MEILDTIDVGQEAKRGNPGYGAGDGGYLSQTGLPYAVGQQAAGATARATGDAAFSGRGSRQASTQPLWGSGWRR